MNTYDLILVWEREDVIEEYQKNKIKFTLCYPTKDCLDIYKQRYRNRGNNELYIKKKINEYKRRVNYFEHMDVEKIVLRKNETLEDYLINHGYHLEK